MKEQTYSFLSLFKTNQGHVQQYFDVSDDSVLFIKSDAPYLSRDPEYIFFTVDRDAIIYDGEGNRVGQFGMFGTKDWCYRGDDGSSAYNLGSDLIKAERLIVERLLAKVPA